MLFDKSYSEIISITRKKSSYFSNYNIALFSNIIIEPLKQLLAYLLQKINLEPHFTEANFDTVLQACYDNNNIISDESNCIILFLYLPKLCSRLCNSFITMNQQDIADETQRVISYIENCITAIRSHSKALLLVHGFNIQHISNYGIYDTLTEQSQNQIIDNINDAIKKITRTTHQCYYLEMNNCLMRIGAENFYNKKQWYLSYMPFSIKGFQEIAIEQYKYISAASGFSKKCLILDCDNILWGGIIGEDGIDGIQLGSDLMGRLYAEFQRTINNLINRGYIIALCSKNNEADVWDVFDNHPHMVLKRSDMAAYAINWDDKSKNIIKIADYLNLGLDSFVFIDDSMFEIELVKQQLPQVSCLYLPSETAYQNVELLMSSAYFEQLNLSFEDRSRNQSYINNVKRRQLKSKYESINDYLSSLLMEATLYKIDEKHVARLCQLFNKTNQFNLTGIRYDENDIYEKIISPNDLIIAIELKDIYDNFGIIGAAVLKIQGSSARINNFLVSCRALARGVEEILINYCLEILSENNVNNVTACYIETKKNNLAEKFYENSGFKLQRQSQLSRKYSKNLDNYKATWPYYFKNINKQAIRILNRINYESENL